ncbi:MAG TPA: dienelactone hydrolase family protein [Burkholderiaceae bacterium]|nr:dienelactone hydrolase family protein [Burkholderiaceae bacterium]
MSMIQLHTQDGQKFDAYFANAPRDDAPGLVLIQEIFGINQAMRTAAHRWAELGFNVVVPDLFWRQQPGVVLEPRIEAEFAKGVELMQAMDQDVAVQDLDLARDWLSKNLGHDRIGALGYCLGGRLVVKMAQAAPIKCAVSYYGVGLENVLPSITDQAAPVLLHIAELDSYVPADVRKTILDDAAARDDWEAYVYPGCDHAFARPGGAHWVDEAAKLAEGRSLAFMKRFLT